MEPERRRPADLQKATWPRRHIPEDPSNLNPSESATQIHDGQLASGERRSNTSRALLTLHTLRAEPGDCSSSRHPTQPDAHQKLLQGCSSSRPSTSTSTISPSGDEAMSATSLLAKQFIETSVFLSDVDQCARTQVELNVGGTVFTTSRHTLCRFPLSKLASLFDGRADSAGVAKDSNGRYFIDRDPGIFRFILNFLRDSRLPPSGWAKRLPHFVSRFQFASELEYLGIPTISSNAAATMNGLRRRESEGVKPQAKQMEKDKDTSESEPEKARVLKNAAHWKVGDFVEVLCSVPIILKVSPSDTRALAANGWYWIHAMIVDVAYDATASEENQEAEVPVDGGNGSSDNMPEDEGEDEDHVRPPFVDLDAEPGTGKLRGVRVHYHRFSPLFDEWLEVDETAEGSGVYVSDRLRWPGVPSNSNELARSVASQGRVEARLYPGDDHIPGLYVWWPGQLVAAYYDEGEPYFVVQLDNLSVEKEFQHYQIRSSEMPYRAPVSLDEGDNGGSAEQRQEQHSQAEASSESEDDSQADEVRGASDGETEPYSSSSSGEDMEYDLEV